MREHQIKRHEPHLVSQAKETAFFHQITFFSENSTLVPFNDFISMLLFTDD